MTAQAPISSAHHQKVPGYDSVLWYDRADADRSVDRIAQMPGHAACIGHMDSATPRIEHLRPVQEFAGRDGG